MASNKISDLIEQLKNDENRPAQADALIPLLEAKQKELGDDATEEQMDQAIQECIMAHLAGSLGMSVDGISGEETQEFMESATTAVKSFFDEEGWHYSERISKPDLVVYELGFNLQNCSLRMRVHVEAVPRVCRIDAILPITADETYDYLLCKAIAKENYPRRYGAMQYDERDGEVSYRYSYPIGHGVYKDDLKRIFLAVANSASDSYAEVKKHCVGRYKKKEINDILKRINALVSDLSDEGE